MVRNDKWVLEWLEDPAQQGDITKEQLTVALNINWNIDGEDLILFIWGMESKMPLEDIAKVEYDDLTDELEEEYSGVYKVTEHSGKISHFAWKYSADCELYEVNI